VEVTGSIPVGSTSEAAGATMSFYSF
jgi:hypothetical protein